MGLFALLCLPRGPGSGLCPLFNGLFVFLLLSFKRSGAPGAGARSVERPASAQVPISCFATLGPKSGSLRPVQSPTWDPLSPSLCPSLPPSPSSKKYMSRKKEFFTHFGHRSVTRGVFYERVPPCTVCRLISITSLAGLASFFVFPT